MGPIGCPETSVENYHYSLRNIPTERSSHLIIGGNLKSRPGQWFALVKAYGLLFVTSNRWIPLTDILGRIARVLCVSTVSSCIVLCGHNCA